MEDKERRNPKLLVSSDNAWLSKSISKAANFLA